MFFTVIPVLIYSQKCSVFATTSGFWGHFLKIVLTFNVLFPLFYSYSLYFPNIIEALKFTFSSGNPKTNPHI